MRTVGTAQVQIAHLSNVAYILGLKQGLCIALSLREARLLLPTGHVGQVGTVTSVPMRGYEGALPRNLCQMQQ